MINRSYILYSFLTFFVFFSCNNISEHEIKKVKDSLLLDSIIVANKPNDSLIILYYPEVEALEKMLIENGLVDIHSLDSSIVVDLKYSSTDNFLKTDVYGTLNRAYLQKEVAGKLIIAQQLLKQKNNHYSLIVYDAARPESIQRKMWNAIDTPLTEKIKFLSNPKYGSLHNFGAAVDVSIVDERLQAIDMGTNYDYMGELAYPLKETELFKKGLLSNDQISNRKLLREVMQQAGFFNIQTEWWHFNACNRAVAEKKYKRLK